MRPFEYCRPDTLEEALRLLNEVGNRPLAGGTDVIPKLRRDQFDVKRLIDISRIKELQFIEQNNQNIHIGALVSHQSMVNNGLLQENAHVLIEAASSIGSRQTRILGTLGGNIANASPAADICPALLVLNTEVHLISINGKRTIALADFFTGPGKTCLSPGEIIHSISFKPLRGRWGSKFLKLGKRSGMAITVASATSAILLDDDGVITDVRMAFGSVSSTPIRSQTAELFLLHKVASVDTFAEAAKASLADISPISDVRSSSEYRRHAAKILAQRSLLAAYIEAGERNAL